jgi:hypothetical protein
MTDFYELWQKAYRIQSLAKHLEQVCFWWSVPQPDHCTGNDGWFDAMWSKTEELVHFLRDREDLDFHELDRIRVQCNSIVNKLHAGPQGTMRSPEVLFLEEKIVKLHGLANALEVQAKQAEEKFFAQDEPQEPQEPIQPKEVEYQATPKDLVNISKKELRILEDKDEQTMTDRYKNPEKWGYYNITPRAVDIERSKKAALEAAKQLRNKKIKKQ